MSEAGSGEWFEGGCHCGAVRFRVRAAERRHLVCNCSICAKKGMLGLIVPEADFELVAVAIDDAESDVRGFQDEYRLSFPIVLDLDQAIYDGYQTMGVPESLLIDRAGRIVERYVGPREWDAPEYVARIREAIEASSGS